MIMKNKDDDEPGENSDDLEERIDAYVKVMVSKYFLLFFLITTLFAGKNVQNCKNIS